MKDGLKDIVGKTITAVAVGSREKNPAHQVMLIFSDGTYFEFWGNSFTCAGGVDRGGIKDACAYIEKCANGEVTDIYEGRHSDFKTCQPPLQTGGDT